MVNKTVRKPKILVNIFGRTLETTAFNESIGPENFEIDRRQIIHTGSHDYADVLNEYDAIIIDCGNACFKRNDNRNSQLKDFLERKKGLLIYILRKLAFQPGCTYNYASVSSLLTQETGKQVSYWSQSGKVALEMFNTQHSGSKYTLTSAGKANIFAKYLDTTTQKWGISLLKECNDKVTPLALNGNDEAIAFALKNYENRAIFLPWLPQNEANFWATTVDAIYGTTKTVEQVEEWVSAYTVPTLGEKNDEIKRIQEKTEELESKKKLIEEERDKLVNIKDTLLFRDGLILQNIVKEVLCNLGLDAKDGPTGREDITFVHNGLHFVLEVKGSTKSMGEDDIRQLKGKKELYEEENKVKAKGVLVANPWRRLPLEERGKPEHSIFPNQMMTLTRIWDFALMTTQQLFVMYCKNMQSKFKLDPFIQKLNTLTGPLEGYNEINKYEVKRDQ